MACHMAEPPAGCDMPFRIAGHGVEQQMIVDGVALFAKDRSVDIRKQHRRMIGCAPEHDAVDMVQMSLSLAQRLNTAIDADETVRIFLLDPVNPAVVQRRYVAIFLRNEPLEPGFPRMHPKRIGAGSKDTGRQFVESDLRVLIIDTDAALDGDRHRDGLFHRGHAFRDE